jgi:hypothetical protein
MGGSYSRFVSLKKDHPDRSLDQRPALQIPDNSSAMFDREQTVSNGVSSVCPSPEIDSGRWITLKHAASLNQFSNPPHRVLKARAPDSLPRPEVGADKTSVPAPVLLCIWLEPSLLKTHLSAWKSAGCVVASASTIREAIVSIAAGDFDLVLLGDRFPVEDRERVAFLIRSTGSAVPIVCVADSCGDLGMAESATSQDAPEIHFDSITKDLVEIESTQPVVTRRSRQT